MRLLRSELVASNAVALCSDAFSRFQNADPNRLQYNLEVSQCFDRLKNSVLPFFLKHLQERGYNRSTLSVEMHMFGINVRHMGLLHKLAREKVFETSKIFFFFSFFC